MKSYNKENLQQSVRNLFLRARYEFDVIHGIKWKFGVSGANGMTKVKVLSYWNNENDCFYATVLELVKANPDSKILISMSVYVKFTDYACSYPVGRCDTPEEVFEWLKNPQSLQECLEIADDLIDQLVDELY